MDLAPSCRRLALGLLPVALALALAAPVAGAAPGLAPATAVKAAPAPRSAPRRMTVEFLRPTAELAGPGALVQVKCTGHEARACVGTLSVEAPGEAPEVAYAIDRGQRRTVVVPLGSHRDLFGGGFGIRTRVVAQTVQISGPAVRTARMLRFQ